MGKAERRQSPQLRYSRSLIGFSGYARDMASDLNQLCNSDNDTSVLSSLVALSNSVLP